MRLQASQHPPTARGHWETLRAVLWEWTDIRPIVQMEETETRVKSLSGAIGQVKGRTGIDLTLAFLGLSQDGQFQHKLVKNWRA